MARSAVAVATLLLATLISPTMAQTGLEFGATRERNLDTSSVRIVIRNTTDHTVELLGGSIRDLRGDRKVARLVPNGRSLAPGDAHEWEWDPERRVGHFRAQLRTSDGVVRDRFEVGTYFTLGFRCDDTPESDCAPVDPFVIWVNEKRPVRQVRADLERREENRRIVSGIVRREMRYNADWSYTMGPGSIVLGEVFIEVCDAHPNYVENHRREWMGERWCPWSSFVEREGR